ncbi:hypothetical protein DM02DRAFT_716750 [Periconia macrospinosa]|uniref:SGNH hydrolase-type esterase domain-containing protein n=1 Tax=Periconia macrospinosa TaxID=97972 RepID=A0A2V1DZ71_9PLEO|nr:hypothetical protein DM02DRAFT_716750 [Periconia macrospinosa]
MGMMSKKAKVRASPTHDSSPPADPRKIITAEFYFEWSGHKVEHLQNFHSFARKLRPEAPVIWLAGDSSLDNKYWVPGSGPGGQELGVEVPEIYQQALTRATPKPDIAFWMNHLYGEKATCINTAIEASMLRERDNKLLPQDDFIRRNIRKDDVLIVSVGGNDIAMKPSAWTIYHMLSLAWLTSKSSIEDGNASSLPYFGSIFKKKTEEYISRLVSVTKPRLVIVCMIYFPLESRHNQESWADISLKCLGYDRWPDQLQTGIRRMFEMGTRQVQVEGARVVPCALYEVMDGTRKEEYTARVEPNQVGGRKMAARFKDILDKEVGM